MFCLFGDAPNDSLMQSFLQYLSETEKEVVQTALSGQNILDLVKSRFNYFFFKVFILPHFNEVFLLCRMIDLSCHRIDLYRFKCGLRSSRQNVLLLGELSNVIRICIT